jgi:hypothetical protein
MAHHTGSSGRPSGLPKEGALRRLPRPPAGDVMPGPGATLALAVCGLFANEAVLGVGVAHGSKSEAFLVKEGLAWSLLTSVETAAWAVVLPPLWRMVCQLRQMVTQRQVTWAIASVACFWVLVWLPWFLVPNATSPLVGESWKTDIMAAAGATVAALAVGGISLVDAVIRTSRFGGTRGTPGRRTTVARQQEELDLYLWLHGRLHRFVWTLGGVVGLATLCVYLLYVGLMAYYGKPTLNVAEIWSFSAYAVTLILAIFLPTYLRLLAAGRRIRDAYYQLALPNQPEYEELRRQRAQIERMLRLNLTSLTSVKTVMAISAPFASSAIAMLSRSVAGK